MSKSIAIVFVLLFLSAMVLGTVCFHPVNAQYQGNITINSDGSISPSAAPIQQDNGIYILTDDVVGDISVMTSNITFDGNRHSIISAGGLTVGVNYNLSPPTATGASNVTVKNLIVENSIFGISLYNTSNSMVINNTILGTGPAVGNIPVAQPTGGIYVVDSGSNIIKENNLVNNYVGIYFSESQNNLIVRNNVVNCSNPFLLGGMAAIVFWGASNNTIYHNNFINNPIQAYDGSFNSAFSVNTWDNGFPSGGNYWSDYSGHGAYVIDQNNVDNYPFTRQVDISAIAPTPTPIEQTAIPIIPIAVSFTVVAVVVVAGLLVYHKKHKHSLVKKV